MNGEPIKRSSSQTHEGFTRSHNPSVSERRPNARISDNHENSQVLRSVFRTEHNLSIIGHAGKERICEERVEHVQRAPTESLQTNQRRTKLAKLHRRFAQLHLPKNRQPWTSRKNRHVPRHTPSATTKNRTPKTNRLTSETPCFPLLTLLLLVQAKIEDDLNQKTCEIRPSLSASMGLGGILSSNQNAGEYGDC